MLQITAQQSGYCHDQAPYDERNTLHNTTLRGEPVPALMHTIHKFAAAAVAGKTLLVSPANDRLIALPSCGSIMAENICNRGAIQSMRTTVKQPPTLIKDDFTWL